ncbi:MAG: C4-type zinc ribbon domain-containing protein [Lapillicoccus sp.]
MDVRRRGQRRLAADLRADLRAAAVAPPPVPASRRYPLKADAPHQLRLLDLQAVDTRLDQLAHQRRTLPQLKDLALLDERAAALDTDLINARTAVSDVQREVDKAEADVQLVRGRATRNQGRLDAGVGTAKDLQALQHELESLSRRQSELEDLELEVMERAEGLAERHAALEASRTDLAGTLDELAAARDTAFARIDDEVEQAKVRRAAIVPEVGEALVTLYEKVRANSGGVGAAELKYRRCGGCQLELNQVDLGRLKSAPSDEVLRCEECNRILVRTAESGL